MEIKSILENAGLSGTETKVYLALLDIGSALAGEITKKSGVNRTNVYDALDKLIEKGLASYVVEANRKYFEASNVERLIKYLEEQEDILKEKKRNVNAILSDLEERRKLGKEPQEATIYRGRKGLQSITEDILRTKKEMFVFGAQGNFVNLFPIYSKQWHMRRAEANIHINIIYNKKVKAQKLNTTFKNIEMRFTNTVEDTPVTTWIYGDKVAISIWSEQPIITLIRSKEVANTYKQFFSILWKEAKK